ncbi:ABC transporter substrate-binding protein [Rhodococcus sp. CH91]|uniref:ABC transporter substrate-binding protein n=1 Tax=Rhodococcus sp. CH91 TaxID=2910256 RepID=UPI001F4ABFDB|nr:ABC transporter substrate-binding protein [Rhodococcus sp. CH91]
MKLNFKRMLLAPALAGALVLTGCGDSGTDETASENTASITIDTNNGEMDVPVSPERVVALDNKSFEMLRDWGITPVALPKTLLPNTGFEEWREDDSILDVGTHREPKLELVSEAEPDLIIGGSRFTEFTGELSKIAPVVDVSALDESEGGYIQGLKDQTLALGQIFEKEAEAEEIVAELDAATEAARAATNGETVFLAVVAGGKIDNGAGRIGRLLEGVNLKDVFAGDAGDVHGDSGLAPETIAQADPDWMIVMDRDAATAVAGEDAPQPAAAVIDAQEAFAGTTFATKDQIIYLDGDFYKREGIESYTEAFQQIADAFDAADTATQ